MALGLTGVVCIRYAKENAQQTGSLTVYVCDAVSGEALKGARVILPEYGKSAVTGKTGSTGEITLSVRRTERLDSVRMADWGELTLLVYCDGYYPCALWNVQLRAGEKRMGPNVYLLPNDGTLDEPFSLVEAPPQSYVSAVLDAYAP